MARNGHATDRARRAHALESTTSSTLTCVRAQVKDAAHDGFATHDGLMTFDGFAARGARPRA